MTLLAQASDTDRYEELRTLLQQVATQTDDLADQQATLARRLSDRTEPPTAPRVEQSRPATPH